jgi:hypothetical protein
MLSRIAPSKQAASNYGARCNLTGVPVDALIA